MASKRSMVRIARALGNRLQYAVGEWKRTVWFWRKFGFMPPPAYTDLSGYEPLLEIIRKLDVTAIDGDVVEIGVFLGGGTYKLSRLLERKAPQKKIYAVDIFDPTVDLTVGAWGASMARLYAGVLNGKNQYEIFSHITRKCRNIVVLRGDSMKITLPCPRIAFAYIDGNHAPEYVRNDFLLVWEKLCARGVVVFDDYGDDLPQVTAAIHQLIGDYADSIAKVWGIGRKMLCLQKR